MVAREFGLDPWVIRRRWTARQFAVAYEWCFLQMSVPSRTDHYIMQVAQEVRRVLSKHPNAIILDHFKIKFVREGEKAEGTTPKMTKEQAAEISKKLWAARLGLKTVPESVTPGSGPTGTLTRAKVPGSVPPSRPPVPSTSRRQPPRRGRAKEND